MNEISFIGGGVYLLVNLFALLFSDQLMFCPQQSSYTRLCHEVRIESANGEKITAVFLEHPSAKYTLLFSHGNAEDLGSVYPFMRQFFQIGCSVLMYDYRGYGTSEGKPSARHAKQDVTAAYRWLTEEQRIDPERIIAHGRSLGGGAAVWLAANFKVGGLIIESTFVSVFRVVTRVPMLPWDPFNNLKSIPEIGCPVLVIHGRDDSLIPFWHGEKLFEAAPDPKRCLWIKGASHNDYAHVAGEAYLTSIQSFIEQCLQP